MARSRREPPEDVFPTEDEIAALCYAMLVDRLSSGQSMTDYWRDAESQLLERAANRILRLYRSPDRG